MKTSINFPSTTWLTNIPYSSRIYFTLFHRSTWTTVAQTRNRMYIARCEHSKALQMTQKMRGRPWIVLQMEISTPTFVKCPTFRLEFHRVSLFTGDLRRVQGVYFQRKFFKRFFLCTHTIHFTLYLCESQHFSTARFWPADDDD